MTFEQAINSEDIQKLANDVINKYNFWIKRYDIYEDLYNLCLVGIWKGLPNYKKDSGVKLETYLYGCMHRQVFTEIKNRYKGYNGAKGEFLLSINYLSTPLSTNEEGETKTLGDTIEAKRMDCDLTLDMLEALQVLTDREYTILVAKVLTRTPSKVLQEEFGLSRSGIDRIYQQAKNKMKARLKIIA